MRLVIKMLDDINTNLAAHDAKLAELVPQSAIPSDMEETSPGTQRSSTTPTMWKLCPADSIVVKDVSWPHEVIFTSEGKPAGYEELSVISFVQGYLTVINTPKQDIKKQMNSHLQDLMEDGEAYG